MSNAPGEIKCHASSIEILCHSVGGTTPTAKDGAEAKRQLHATCDDADLLEELENHRKEIRRLGKRRIELILGIKQDRQTADGDRHEAGITQWPSKSVAYINHAEVLEGRVQQMEAELPGVLEQLEQIDRREKELRERMLEV